MSSLLRKKSSRKNTSDDADSVGASVDSRSRSARSRSPLRQASKKSKSIIGLITGESKRRKKQEEEKKRREAALAAVNDIAATLESTEKIEQRSSTEPEIDDEDTVYGVQLDNNLDNKLISIKTPSKKTDSSETSELGVPIEIVLLLVDSGSRRFELLQLEFDSAKAVVKDIISQIPASATEATLKKQEYSGVCSPNGGEVMESNEPITKYCKGNEVLVAIPADISAEECQKLAKPILSDPSIGKLLNNLNITGFEEKPAETQPQEATEEKPEEVEPEKTTDETESTPIKVNGGSMDKSEPSDNDSEKVSKSGSSFGLLVVFIAIMVPIMWKYQAVVTSPLSPGDVISPGEKRSRCGILSVLPASASECTSSYIQMGHDGVLKIFDEENVEAVTFTGGDCEDSDDTCVPGTLVTESGQLLIGGETPKLSGDKDFELSPWPFTENIYNKRGKL